MAAYRYSPLTKAGEIRLLWLDYGQPSDQLSCELLVVDSNDCAEYEALSYAWGEHKFTCSIYCNNRARIPITENLFRALRQLRYANRPRLLWVDAVCVNQHDLLERSSQIRLMSFIYTGAQKVIAWLGDDTFNGGLAFSELKHLSKHLNSAASDNYLQPGHQGGTEQFVAIQHLFEQSWFTRIWIVQEVSLARKATIVCGDCTMDWSEFHHIAKAFYASGKFKFTTPSPVRDSLHQLSEIPVLGSADLRTLLMLLFVFRQSQASDDRDKLFALVGIASDAGKWSSIYDYTRRVTDVYVDFACQEICKYCNPDLLTHCSLPDNTEPHLALPSWVPDWSRRLPSNPSPIIAPGVYHSAGETSFSGRVGSEEGTLLVDGAFLATVERIGRSTVEEQFDNMAATDSPYGKSRCDRLDECFDIASMSKALGHEYKSACLRAMVANLDRNGNRLNISDADLAAQYAQYRKIWDEFFEWNEQSKSRDVTLAAVNAPKKETSSPLPTNLWIERALDVATLGRRFCLFSDGLIGYVPEKAELGDRVISFLGATAPILLRPFGDSFLVVGESYVHGMMEGQAFKNPNLAIQRIMLR